MNVRCKSDRITYVDETNLCQLVVSITALMIRLTESRRDEVTGAAQVWGEESPTPVAPSSFQGFIDLDHGLIVSRVVSESIIALKVHFNPLRRPLRRRESMIGLIVEYRISNS